MCHPYITKPEKIIYVPIFFINITSAQYFSANSSNMSQTSKSSGKQTVRSLENEAGSLKPKTEQSQESYNGIEKSVHELLSNSGSASSTESLLLTGSEDNETDDKFEESDHDPDMTLILDALERSVGSSKVKKQNKTFSEQKIREIERKNAILMDKILSHSHRASHFTSTPHTTKISNAEVNRKKQQKQIDHDNLILLRKIQTVKPFGLSHAKR